jgi:hypothetical protein
MIVYKFNLQNFSVREGYTGITVTNGELRLNTEPDKETLELIERLGGKRVKKISKAKKRKVVR